MARKGGKMVIYESQILVLTLYISNNCSTFGIWLKGVLHKKNEKISIFKLSQQVSSRKLLKMFTVGF